MSWKTVRLGEIFEIARGGSPRPIESYLTNDENGVNWIMIGDTKDSGKYIEKTAKKIKREGISNSRMVNEGDFLLTNSMSFGRPYILKTSGCIHDGWLVLSPKDENIHRDYFYYYLGSDEIKQRLTSKAAGAVVKNLNKEIVSDLEIELPPLATQKRIAEILDAADALRRKDQELLKKYDELAQAIFIDMFGDPVKNEKGWDVKKLKDFGSISTGNTPSRADKTNFDSNYIEWIKTDNIGENKLFVTQSSEYLSEVGSKKGRITPKGSLLVACIAGSVESIGRAALTDRQVAFNQQINSIQPNSNVNAKFLYYLFKFSRKHIQNHASNGMKRMLSKGEFEKIKMILPELNVQNNFNKVIQQFEFQTDQLKDSNFKSMDLFNNLIQKAFKGELVS